VVSPRISRVLSPSLGTYFGVNCSSLKIVTRKEWGARAPKDTIDLKLPVGKMFLHHTAMAPCFTKPDCIKMVRKIQDFHMDTRGRCQYPLYTYFAVNTIFL